MPRVISALQRVQGVHSTIFRKEESESLRLQQMRTVFPSAHIQWHPCISFATKQMPQGSGLQWTWPDSSLTQAPPTGSCTSPVGIRDHLPVGPVSLMAQSRFSCDFLGEGSGPFTQHENRERCPAGKPQLIKDKCSYTGGWEMRTGW